jgi:hypothetical protein
MVLRFEGESTLSCDTKLIQRLLLNVNISPKYGVNTHGIDAYLD